MEAVHGIATLAQFTRLNFFNFHPLDPKKRRDFLAAAGPLYRDTTGFRMEAPLAEAVLARSGAWPRQVNGAWGGGA